MKVLGIVILYYPKNELANNFASFIDAIDKLIVWDNTPTPPEIDLPENPKIIRMGLSENVGIGRALNEAAGYAKANNYTHLLTMDQDSYFKDDDCRIFLETVEKSKEKAIFSPNYLVHNEAFYADSKELLEIAISMTSGSLYPVEIFEKTGLFRDDFFIDCIDQEFTFRAKQKGIPSKAVPFVYLVHGLGYQRKKHKFLWKTFFPNEYSPVRSYYIVRNGIITQKLYPGTPWAKDYLFYWFYKRIFFVICYEDQKGAKLKALVLGYIHGKMGKLNHVV